jgi:transposase-like protein
VNGPDTQRSSAIRDRTPTPTPVCPRCNRSDRVHVEDQSGSSARWYLCEACGTRFIVPPKRAN